MRCSPKWLRSEVLLLAMPASFGFVFSRRKMVHLSTDWLELAKAYKSYDLESLTIGFVLATIRLSIGMVLADN